MIGAEMFFSPKTLPQMCNIHKICGEIRSNREKYPFSLALPPVLGYNIIYRLLVLSQKFNLKYSTTAGG